MCMYNFNFYKTQLKLFYFREIEAWELIFLSSLKKINIKIY